MSYIRNLEALESRARRLLRESSYDTVWGYFVPFQVYEELRRRLDEYKEEYAELHQRIYRDYDTICTSTSIRYREAAVEVYRTLQKDTDARVPESFIDNFVFRVMRAFPTVRMIQKTCKFEINLSFVPITSMPAAEIESRLVSGVWRDAQASVAEEIRQTYSRHVEGFISDIGAQLRYMIFEAVFTARESVRKNGYLLGQNSRALRNLTEKVRRLNFMEDQVVIQQLGELNEMLDTSPERRDAGEITEILHSIAEENRQVLLALGHKPRAARGQVELKTEPQESGIGRKRRGVFTNTAEEIINADVNDQPSRHRRGTAAMETLAW